MSVVKTASTIGMADEFPTFGQRATIKVCGIGGGGGNAVSRMMEAGLDGVDFIAINTDSQDLRRSPASVRLQIGAEVTAGLGSGARPEVGRMAAEEDRDRIEEALRGSDMVFLTAGLGGGTGTGATPVVAEVASATGALTLAIVTLPFTFEGGERHANALAGLKALEAHVDALIVVPNDRLAELTQNISFLSAFQQADEVLHNGVRAISQIITVPGLVNVDFADVRTIMLGGGRTLMGIGAAQEDQRARRAAEEAMVCPLLEQSTIDGAMGVIVNIRGGRDITMREVLDAVSTVREVADPRANIIFGAMVEEEERPDVQVTVIASRFPVAASELSPATAGHPVFPTPRPKPEPAPSAPSAPAAVCDLDPGVGAAPPARPAPETREVRPPEIQDLFPPEAMQATASSPAAAPAPAPGENGPEEDPNIPTWMRNRRRMSKGSSS